MNRTTELYLIVAPKDQGAWPFGWTAAPEARDAKRIFAENMDEKWGDLVKKGYRSKRYFCSPIIKEPKQ